MSLKKLVDHCLLGSEFFIQSAGAIGSGYSLYRIYRVLEPVFQESSEQILQADELLKWGGIMILSGGVFVASVIPRTLYNWIHDEKG